MKEFCLRTGELHALSSARLHACGSHPPWLPGHFQRPYLCCKLYVHDGSSTVPPECGS